MTCILVIIEFKINFNFFKNTKQIRIDHVVIKTRCGAATVEMKSSVGNWNLQSYKHQFNV